MPRAISPTTKHAIHAIGAAVRRARHATRGPGISVKLSALHPRYVRAQRERVMAELLPRLRPRRAGAALRHRPEHRRRGSRPARPVARSAGGAVLRPGRWPAGTASASSCRPTRSARPACWTGSIDLARRSGRRLMVRLVKGAYWDSEIKRAQVDGLEDFPVFTRKIHTDVSYLACARRLLAAPDAVFPQFATHNAHDARDDPSRMAGAIFTPGSTNSSACTAWASRSTRRSSAATAGPAVPHLRAGRHARNAAGLSGAAAAGEWREHLVRQPHRRCRPCRSRR